MNNSRFFKLWAYNRCHFYQWPLNRYTSFRKFDLSIRKWDHQNGGLDNLKKKSILFSLLFHVNNFDQPNENIFYTLLFALSYLTQKVVIIGAKYSTSIFFHDRGIASKQCNQKISMHHDINRKGTSVERKEIDSSL